MTLAVVLVIGFCLGVRHATDSDHVVAVTTIVSRERSVGAAAWVGVLWGLGHTVTLLLFGGGIVLFGWEISPRLGLSMEMLVAVMLIALGVGNISGVLPRLNERVHRQHAPHPHDESSFEREPAPYAHLGRLRPFAVGVVHGLAGSAAIALLVLGTIKSVSLALVYLALFGAGTVAGMLLLTLAMSLPISMLARRLARVEQLTARLTGALSIAFGLFLAYRIGVSDGLFLGVPHWKPR